MKYLKLVLLLLICTVSMLGGCAQKQPQPSASPGGYMVLDDTGSKVYLKGKPQKIVSLTYGTDEIVLALVGTGRITAFSRWAGDDGITFVTEKEAEEVGRKVNNNLEEIYGLQPDLVLVSTSTDGELVNALKSVKLTVYVAQSPKNYEEMCRKISGIAKAVGEDAKGKEIIKSMDARLAALEDKLSGITGDKEKVVISFGFSGAVGRKGDLFDDMLHLAHIINGAGLLKNRGTSVNLSKEQVVEVNPDIFLLPTWNYDKREDADAYKKEILNDPAYKDVKAVKNKQLISVPDRYRYVASQYIVEAVEQLAMAVYPEVFKEDGR